MKKRRSAARFAATAMALLLLPSSLFLFTACGEGESGAYTPEVQSVTTEGGGASVQTEVAVPEAEASYNFASSGFNETEWTKVEIGSGSVTRTDGAGVNIPYGLNNARMGYAVANPLKGKLTDGFAVIVTGQLGEGQNDYESFFGFNQTADPVSDPFNFFYVAGSGTGVRLNLNDETQSTSDGTKFYDIIGGDVLDMSERSQYILSVNAEAISVWLNGNSVAEYQWTPGNISAYSYDTVGAVGQAEFFNLGIAGSIWGNTEMTIESVSLYSQALSEEEITAINDQYADFSSLNALLTDFDLLDFVNYDKTDPGWATAYDALTAAVEEAHALDFFTADQSEVDAAASKLRQALDGLEAFYITPDLTQGLYAAYPLGGSGANLVGTDKDTVKYMNGSAALTEITSALSVTKQRLAGTKLYDESKLHPRDLWDTSATATTGLKIPADAFSSSMQTSGMTLSVSIYAETLYKPWARILQLGTKGSGEGYSDGTGLYFAYSNGGVVRINNGDNAVSGIIFTTDGNPATPFCTVIAGEWTDVSVVFDAFSHSITFYVSSAATARSYGTENGSIRAELSESAFNAVYSAVLNGKDNWIGRSFWSVDGNQVAYARNLSVYGRALTPDEVALLHETDDLASLVA